MQRTDAHRPAPPVRPAAPPAAARWYGTLARPALVLPVLVLSVAAVACGGSGAAPGEARGIPEGGRLVVTTEGGVRIVGTDTADVRVAGGAAARWSADGKDRTLDLPCAGAAREDCGRMPLVRVPRGTAVTVEARNAGVEVTDVRGPLRLGTVNGDVVVRDSGDAHGLQRLATRNGSVRATGLAARRVEAGTVNGDVDLRTTTSPVRLSGTTRNGSVRVTLPENPPPYAVRATTVNGRTVNDLPDASAASDHRLTLRTVNGDTEVHPG
ncbi:hypothetical protein STTU_4966 [Streptomyces sp. Tu6071]|uniref:DUF4097 family beta strand repeat-containing protein n=1 Tax=Streptomyces evansiae TaxID=3075535 RepID=A0ABD5DZK7_9ACTN|nr:MULTISPECIES: DUF4097 family beta strand repeat-containing protein [unclassified Streptomyces]EGJ77755.1 hypothetical protein STTU_4966 [Streptomyces sp. Tu6071]MDT0413962.1 DUF4097 family beta strand repeat-containing protein [Streptomyces sp. DSM 41982]SCD66425.1 hypothetical protein GA0115246_104342 [Streptomyces sp. SolWspMP-sol7th]